MVRHESATRATTYLARRILPIEGPPLEQGYLTVVGERIAALGPKQDVGARADHGRTIDLGDVTLLPGFVNAHTHLEFGDLLQPLGRAGMRFPDWIREVLKYRRTVEFDPVRALHTGLREATRFGTTLIGDIASSAPDTLFDATPPDAAVVSFVELIGLGESRSAGQQARLDEFLARADVPNSLRGISPHAPYTVRPALIEAALARSREQRVPTAMHLAESREELQLLHSGTGPFCELLRELGAWDPTAIPLGTVPLDYLRTLSRAHRALVVHGNYLAPDEIEFLAAHADRMTVVYCPRTHAYFGHEPHPLPQLLAAGAAVALGTDGRCTNPDLNLLAEMRTVARAFPQLAPERIVRLGTLDGAQALGLHQEAGSLRPGKLADFIAVAAPSEIDDPFATLLSDESQVVGTWKRGREVWRATTAP
ncbi:MAG: amidohydrolase family protein [Planctomycetia bacterium]|nr:amidohydrolase family protein [Planctomycetia bacterium]